jgi:hypothetical protein
MRSDVRPESVYQVRRDRALRPRRVTPEVTAAFRVHWSQPNGSENVHKVSDLLWESEAVTLADTLSTIPGVVLLATPDRPRGIESVRGHEDTYKTADSLLPFAWHRTKAEQIGERVAEAEFEFSPFLGSLQMELVDLLRSAPENVQPELLALYHAARKSELENLRARLEHDHPVDGPFRSACHACDLEIALENRA